MNLLTYLDHQKTPTNLLPEKVPMRNESRSTQPFSILDHLPLPVGRTVESLTTEELATQVLHLLNYLITDPAFLRSAQTNISITFRELGKKNPQLRMVLDDLYQYNRNKLIFLTQFESNQPLSEQQKARKKRTIFAFQFRLAVLQGEILAEAGNTFNQPPVQARDDDDDRVDNTISTADLFQFDLNDFLEAPKKTNS